MTLTTKFVNKTTTDFKVKEGNNGVFGELCTLKGTAGSATDVPSEYVVELDTKATYREYMTVSRKGRQKIPITLDFCLDHSVIYIIPKPGNPDEYEIKGVPRPEKTLKFKLGGLLSKFMGLILR